LEEEKKEGNGGGLTLLKTLMILRGKKKLTCNSAKPVKVKNIKYDLQYLSRKTPAPAILPQASLLCLDITLSYFI
jgi:hypothetical protein